MGAVQEKDCREVSGNRLECVWNRSKQTDTQNELVVCLGCEREQQMDKLQECEGGVGCHRWMTKRKEQKKVDGRRVRSGTEEQA